MSLPDPPENVRVEYADGRVIPCELVYIGDDATGIHCWEAVTPVPVTPVDLAVGRAVIRAGMIPAGTAITLPVALS